MKPISIEKKINLVNRTIAEIERRGWIQHTEVDLAGQVCLRGGFLSSLECPTYVKSTPSGYEICFLDKELSLDEQILLNEIEIYFNKWLHDKLYPHGMSYGVSYSSWNDRIGRTKKEVIDMLKMFGKHLRSLR